MISDIIAATADRFNVTSEDITGNRRPAAIAAARFAAVHVAAQVTRLSVADIGVALGDRDHSTIVHASQRARAMRATDEDFRKATDELVARFNTSNTRVAALLAII